MIPPGAGRVMQDEIVVFLKRLIHFEYSERSQ